MGKTGSYIYIYVENGHDIYIYICKVYKEYKYIIAFLNTHISLYIHIFLFYTYVNIYIYIHVYLLHWGCCNFPVSSKKLKNTQKGGSFLAVFLHRACLYLFVGFEANGKMTMGLTLFVEWLQFSWACSCCWRKMLCCLRMPICTVLQL